MARREGAWFPIDREGRPLTDEVYEATLGFHTNVAAVARGGRWSFIGADGRALTEDWYDEVSNFVGDGLAVARLGADFCFLDRATLLPVSAQRYAHATPPNSEGTAVVTDVSGGRARIHVRSGRVLYALPSVFA